MTKPHFSTISSSGSHEIQESMGKGLNCISEPDTNRSSLQIPLMGLFWDGIGVAGLTLRTTSSSSHHPVAHPDDSTVTTHQEET